MIPYAILYRILYRGVFHLTQTVVSIDTVST
jgi:hypothetical protein